MAEIVIIDGDTVAFRSAAMNERKTIKATHRATGRVKEFKHRTELKEAVGDKWDISDFDIEELQEADEIAYALGSAKATIKSICEACETTNYKVVLSGDTNFRLQLPLPTQYKSNRANMLRPLQLKEVRQYLVKFHAAEFSVGCEADDVLASWAYKGWKEGRLIIQASVDKDAYSNMGWLYNFVKPEGPLFIDGLGELHMDKWGVKGTGRKWYYAQWLLGDGVDGYKPTDLCKARFGDKSVLKLLGDLKTDRDCIAAVAETYRKWYPEIVEYTAWDGTPQRKDYVEIMQMYSDCCHMRRWENDRVIVKDVLTKLGITY